MELMTTQGLTPRERNGALLKLIYDGGPAFASNRALDEYIIAALTD